MTMNDIRFGNRLIGKSHSPFIIAEMSGNHNGSLERALEIVERAAECGAHAIKLQTYTADTITLDVKEGEFYIDNPDSLWKGKSLYDLYEEAHTPWEWHEPIFNKAKKLGMLAFSSPFDHSAVDFLENLNVPAYKVASFEIVDIPLIKKIASTQKPMIMSTGMANLEEIKEAVQAARDGGCQDIILLKCTSSYPATPKDSNLLGMRVLEEKFNVQVGLSDHTLGIGAALASVALGATVIEKHFTLDRNDGGVDSSFSLDPAELKLLVEESKRAWESLGKPIVERQSAEENSTQFRRSLYISENMKAGDVLNSKNLRSVRPGYGLPPKHYDELLGKKITADAQKGTPMSWDLVK